MVTEGSQPIVTATKAEEQLGADSWTSRLALNPQCLLLYHSIMATPYMPAGQPTYITRTVRAREAESAGM